MKPISYWVTDTDIDMEPENSGLVGSAHDHAAILIKIFNDEFGLSAPTYQMQSDWIQFEDMDDTTIHKHATGVTLGYLFKTLSIGQLCFPIQALRTFTINLVRKQCQATRESCSLWQLRRVYRSWETKLIGLDEECFVFQDGREFCTNDEYDLKFFVNGEVRSSITDYEIFEDGRILISYGASPEHLESHMLQLENQIIVK